MANMTEAVGKYGAGALAVGVTGAAIGLLSRGVILKVTGLALATLGAWGFLATLACAGYAYYNGGDVRDFTDNIHKFIFVVDGAATAAMLTSNYLFYAIVWGWL